MSDIIIPVCTDGEVKYQIWPKRITICNPFNGSKAISFSSERITFVNDEECNTVQDNSINRSFDDVEAETITFTDPVTEQEVTISVAGIVSAMEEAYSNWWAEDNA